MLLIGPVKSTRPDWAAKKVTGPFKERLRSWRYSRRCNRPAPRCRCRVPLLTTILRSRGQVEDCCRRLAVGPIGQEGEVGPARRVIVTPATPITQRCGAHAQGARLGVVGIVVRSRIEEPAPGQLQAGCVEGVAAGRRASCRYRPRLLPNVRLTAPPNRESPIAPAYSPSGSLSCAPRIDETARWCRPTLNSGRSGSPGPASYWRSGEPSTRLPGI